VKANHRRVRSATSQAHHASAIKQASATDSEPARLGVKSHGMNAVSTNANRVRPRRPIPSRTVRATKSAVATLMSVEPKRTERAVGPSTAIRGTKVYTNSGLLYSPKARK